MKPHSCTLLALVVGLTLVAQTRVALAAESLDVEGWRIGLGAFGGFQVGKAEAESSTGDVLGPASTIPAPDPIQIRPPTEGESTQVGGLLLATLELSTPVWGDSIPGRPRLFAHLDVGGNFALEDDVSRADNPARRLEIDPLLLGTNEIDPNALLGQGSRTTLNTEPLTYSAGIGVSFEFEAWDRVLRIKPSAEYLAHRVTASGIVSRAIVINGVGLNPNGLEDFRHILIEESRERTFHGAGVGFEVEVDALEADPFVVSVFANTRALNILGGREISLLGRNSGDPDPDAQRESARFRVQLDEWVVRAGVGIRVRWSPDRR